MTQKSGRTSLSSDAGQLAIAEAARAEPDAAAALPRDWRFVLVRRPPHVGRLLCVSFGGMAKVTR